LDKSNSSKSLFFGWIFLPRQNVENEGLFVATMCVMQNLFLWPWRWLIILDVFPLWTCLLAGTYTHSCVVFSPISIDM
jgi:hypothetical protein